MASCAAGGRLCVEPATQVANAHGRCGDRGSQCRRAVLCRSERPARRSASHRQRYGRTGGAATREHNLIWRQGKRSLLSGSLLFITGIGLSYLFTRPVMGEFANELLGNGVFLVVAWVGLRYPFDLLFIAREQAKREMRVLGNMLILPVAVRAGKSVRPGAVTPGTPEGRVCRQASGSIPWFSWSVQIGPLGQLADGRQRSTPPTNEKRALSLAWIHRQIG